MNSNQKAIKAYLNDDYAEALKYFEKAVEENENVQSLNNLAWFYLHEIGDEDKALTLIKKAIELKPNSHFPYNIGGEIYLMKKQWLEAEKVFRKAIQIKDTEETNYSLAYTYFELGDKDEALKYFKKVTKGSDNAWYFYIRCLIGLGKIKEVERELELFDEEYENFVGDLEIAELYYRIDEYETAIEWFEKAINTYAVEEDWIKSYLYSLLKIGEKMKAGKMINSIIEKEEKELEELKQDTDYTEYWTEKDKKENIEQYILEIDSLKKLMENVSLENKPEAPYTTVIYGASDCYLFGCTKCVHTEYRGENN